VPLFAPTLNPSTAPSCYVIAKMEVRRHRPLIEKPVLALGLQAVSRCSPLASASFDPWAMFQESDHD
jgi:hypothetical protein